MAPATNLTQNLLVKLPALAPDWRRQFLGSRSYWLAQILGWGAFALAELASSLTSDSPSRLDSLAESIVVPLVGILCTHLLRIVCLETRKRSLSLGQVILRHIPAALVASNLFALILHLARIAWINREPLAAQPPLEGSLYDYFSLLTRCAFFIFAWLGLYFGTHYYRNFQRSTIERLQLERNLREAELQSLKSQLNPHFLFNSLNTIRALIPLEHTAPRLAVTNLSELLRASLRHGNAPLIPLSEELEAVENYLALERLRHEDRLVVEQSIPSETLPCLLPPFALQTLVENAMHHGIAQLKQGGSLRIHAALDRDTLRLEIENPGRIEPNQRSTGIGLANLRAQLTLLFADSASLTLAETAQNTVLASLAIPQNRPLP